MNPYSEFRLNGQAVPTAKPMNIFARCYLSLRRTKHHVLVILLAMAWVICPFDGDFIPVVGFLDDGVMAGLAIKHLLDLCGIHIDDWLPGDRPEQSPISPSNPDFTDFDEHLVIDAARIVDRGSERID